MVIDHGVQVTGSELGVAPLVAWNVRGGSAAALALLTADVAPGAAVRDPAELLDVDVEHVPGPFMLIAADRFAGGPVEVGEPVDPAADQDRVHPRGRHVEPISDLDGAESLLPPQVHVAPRHRCSWPALLPLGCVGPTSAKPKRPPSSKY